MGLEDMAEAEEVGSGDRCRFWRSGCFAGRVSPKDSGERCSLLGQNTRM
jgi:hypothetical protein